jgi:hypothetical protein
VDENAGEGAGEAARLSLIVSHPGWRSGIASPFRYEQGLPEVTVTPFGIHPGERGATLPPFALHQAEHARTAGPIRFHPGESEGPVGR